MDKRIPVIIDTDPGIDDALAILLAASCERLELVGLTPVAGNVCAAHTFKNALDLADYLELGCPVAKGAEHQLTIQCPGSASDVHGETGLGNVVLPPAKQLYDSRPAWDFIYDTAKARGGELVLIAIGPLTNIALCIQKHPDVKNYIKQIVIMGGGVSGGNRTPFAEFNFWVDPPAAGVVFRSGIPIAMAGLNVTMQTGVPTEYLIGLSKTPSRVSKILSGAVETYHDRARARGGQEVSIVHDAVAVFYAAYPEHCHTEMCAITVNEDGEDERFGESVADFENPIDFNTALIESIDMDAYLAQYKHMNDHYANMN